jgi:hypothetical protein
MRGSKFYGYVANRIILGHKDIKKWAKLSTKCKIFIKMKFFLFLKTTIALFKRLNNTNTIHFTLHFALHSSFVMKKNIVKRYLILLVMTVGVVMSAFAQDDLVQMSGVVRDAKTGKVISQVAVSAQGGHEATVTNADGAFSIKTPRMPRSLIFSHIGYQTAVIPMSEGKLTNLKVRMQPSSIMLSEVVVPANKPLEIVLAAIDKIKENYSHNPELMRCFYRETTQKGRRYIYVAEAVIDLYKSPYNRIMHNDRVSIIKGRRIVSTQASDTLGAKMQGGPTLPIHIDLMKNREYLLNKEELSLYNLQMEVPTSLDGRPQFVISFSPAFRVDHVLNYGKMYIDQQTLAFTRIEMSLDMSDQDLATQAMLLSKPIGVRFKPREMITTVAYTYDGTVSRIQYVHSDVRFNCEWKRKLFAAPYHVEAEMVVTDLLSTEATPISGKSSFRSNESFYDKVQFFADSDFWKDYNIIEPTESLEHAIEKLRKKQ